MCTALCWPGPVKTHTDLHLALANGCNVSVAKLLCLFWRSSRGEGGMPNDFQHAHIQANLSWALILESIEFGLSSCRNSVPQSNLLSNFVLKLTLRRRTASNTSPTLPHLVGGPTRTRLALNCGMFVLFLWAANIQYSQRWKQSTIVFLNESEV